MDKVQFEDERQDLKNKVLELYNNKLVGTAVGSWSIQDAHKFNDLLRQLMGTVELMDYTKVVSDGSDEN